MRLFRPALLIAMALTVAPAAHAGDLSLGIHFGNKGSKVHAVVGSGGHGGHGGHGHSHYAPRKIWVSGFYDTVVHQVWVPGTKTKVFIDPVYETRYDYCGRPYRVLVCRGYWTVKELPGHYETRRERVWRPGYWRSGPICD